MTLTQQEPPETTVPTVVNTGLASPTFTTLPNPDPPKALFGEEGAQPGLSPQAKVLSGSGLGDSWGTSTQQPDKSEQEQTRHTEPDGEHTSAP